MGDTESMWVHNKYVVQAFESAGQQAAWMELKNTLLNWDHTKKKITDDHPQKYSYCCFHLPHEQHTRACYCVGVLNNEDIVDYSVMVHNYQIEKVRYNHRTREFEGYCCDELTDPDGVVEKLSEEWMRENMEDTFVHDLIRRSETSTRFITLPVGCAMKPVQIPTSLLV